MGEFFSDRELLQRLCRLSDGHVRMLFIPIRSALERCDQLPLTSEVLDRTVRRQAGDISLAVDANRWQALAEVHRTKKPVEDDPELWYGLLKDLFVYGYEDELGGWYDWNPCSARCPRLVGLPPKHDGNQDPAGRIFDREPGRAYGSLQHAGARRWVHVGLRAGEPPEAVRAPGRRNSPLLAGKSDQRADARPAVTERRCRPVGRGLRSPEARRRVSSPSTVRSGIGWARPTPCSPWAAWPAKPATRPR